MQEPRIVVSKTGSAASAAWPMPTVVRSFDLRAVFEAVMVFVIVPKDVSQGHV